MHCTVEAIKSMHNRAIQEIWDPPSIGLKYGTVNTLSFNQRQGACLYILSELGGSTRSSSGYMFLCLKIKLFLCCFFMDEEEKSISAHFIMEYTIPVK